LNKLLLIPVLIAFIIFVVTWILTKVIGNSPESRVAVAKIFRGYGIVIFVIFILYVTISYIFNLNNGSQVNLFSYGGGSSTVPFRESDVFYILGLVWLGLIMLVYNIFQFIYVKYLKYKPHTIV
jgi:hypothetical protein